MLKIGGETIKKGLLQIFSGKNLKRKIIIGNQLKQAIAEILVFMIKRKERVRSPNYRQIRAARTFRQLKKRAAKLRRDINKKSFEARKKKQKRELEIKTARIRALAGSKKTPPVCAKRPVLKILLEKLSAKKRLTRQWANIARELLTNGLMELNAKSDLRQVMFNALNRINPRAAEFFRTNKQIYLPKGEMPLQERLKRATTKERHLITVSVQRGKIVQKVRAVKRPGKPVKYKKLADGRIVIEQKHEKSEFRF